MVSYWSVYIAYVMIIPQNLPATNMFMCYTNRAPYCHSQLSTVIRELMYILYHIQVLPGSNTCSCIVCY